MSSMINKAVLVLNSSFEPVSITRAKNALKLLGKRRSGSRRRLRGRCIPGPSPSMVIRLRNYKKIPIRISILTRPNIYARDHYLCLYCGSKEGSSKIINGKPVRTVLTLDHILPESRGGPFAWDNLASSCKTCNLKKGDRTPEEAGMPLLHSPGRLTIHTSRALLRLVGLEEDARWKKYLFC